MNSVGLALRDIPRLKVQARFELPAFAAPIEFAVFAFVMDENHRDAGATCAYCQCLDTVDERVGFVKPVGQCPTSLAQAQSPPTIKYIGSKNKETKT